MLCAGRHFGKRVKGLEGSSRPPTEEAETQFASTKIHEEKRFRGPAISANDRRATYDSNYGGTKISILSTNNISIGDGKIDRSERMMYSLGPVGRESDGSIQRLSKRTEVSVPQFLDEKSDLIQCCGIPTKARDLHIAENIEASDELYFHDEFTGGSKNSYLFPITIKRLIKNPEGQSGSGPVQGLQWLEGSRRIQGPRLTKLRKTAF